MRQPMVFLLVFAHLVTAEAFIFRRFEPIENINMTPDQIRAKSARMSCQIEENFDQFTDHLVDIIFPRISSELLFLTRPRFTIDGERVQVAESVDSGDLFHVHLRTPLINSSLLAQTAFDYYLDPNKYHLQYHSFERAGVIKKKWRRELDEIEDYELSEWLKKLDRHNFLLQSVQDSGYEYATVEIESPLTEPLTEEQRRRFANLLYRHLRRDRMVSEDYRRWLIKRLETRFNFLDPNKIAFENFFSESRSVASTGIEFLIMNSININGYQQFANIYFEDRSDMSASFESFISEAESHGKSFFVRQSGESFSQAVQLIKTETDELNALRYAYESDVSAKNHRVIGWTSDHVFSVSFSLSCKH